MTSELKGLAIKGVGWLVAKRLFGQVIVTSSNLILVRFLFPKDFGTFAIIQFLVTIVWVLADFGLGKALIQSSKKPDSLLLQTVWWTQFVLAVFVFGVVWFLSPLIMIYYSGQIDSEAVNWLRLFAVSQIFVNMGLVSSSLLERKLDYSRFFVSEIPGLFVIQSLTILFAVWGYGTISFVYGNIAGKLLNLILLFYISPWQWGFGWSFSKLKPFLSFGIRFQMSTWFSVLNGAVVPVFVGRFPGPGGFSGAEAVGFVVWGAGIATVPAAGATIIEQILFPLMSRLQNNPEQAGKIYKRILTILSILTFLASSLLIALAPEVTKIIYTPIWLPGVPLLRLAVIQTVIVSLTNIAFNSLLAFGESKFFFNMHLLWAILQWIFTIPLVLFFGFWGVGLGGILVSLTALYAYPRLNKHFDISIIEITKIPFVLSFFTGILVYFAARSFPVTDILRLFLLSGLGSVAYFLLIFVFLKNEITGDLNLAFDIIKVFKLKK